MPGTSRLAAILWVALTAAAAADARAVETDHAIDVKCASVASAAVTGARTAPSGRDRKDDDELVRVTRARAQASGRAAGVSADDVDRSIEAGASKILRNLSKTADAAETKQEQLDLGRVLLECAILQTKR